MTAATRSAAGGAPPVTGEARQLHCLVVLITDGDLDSIKARVGLRTVRLTAAAPPVLPAAAGVERCAYEGQQRYVLHTRDADQLIHGLVHSGIGFRDLEVHKTSLEEAFLQLTEAATPTRQAAAHQ